MRRIVLLPILATLSGCFSGIVTPEPEKYYIFQMPEVHGTGKEYLVCIDTIRNGRNPSCRFNGGMEGRYEETFDHSYLDFPNDSTIQWPNFDHWKPIFIRRSH